MLRVDPLLHQLLALPQQLTSQHSYSGGAVTNLLILGLRNLDQDLGGRVVDVHRTEDSGAIVGHGDVPLLGSRAYRA